MDRKGTGGLGPGTAERDRGIGTGDRAGSWKVLMQISFPQFVIPFSDIGTYLPSIESSFAFYKKFKGL